MVTRIRHEGLQRSQVMETLRGLTDGFGARLTASPALQDASAWTESRFRDWGVARVWQEPFPFGEGWSFSATTVTGVKPFTGPMRALPLAWTVGTDGPVRGEVLRVKLEAEKDFDGLRGKIRGRILLLEPNTANVRGGPPAQVVKDPTEERPFLRHEAQTLEDLATYRITSEPPTGLSPADEVAVFKAAGLVNKGKQWRGDCEDPGTAADLPPVIETVRDLNGDGRPEAVIVEGSTLCYGMPGQGFVLVSQQADGRWTRLARETGVPRFLVTRGKDGWPDLEIGGPGFCFPVQRWNGRAYAQHRMEYEGKACRRK